jgi:uncharacterized protein (DUF924 family)
VAVAVAVLRLRKSTSTPTPTGIFLFTLLISPPNWSHPFMSPETGPEDVLSFWFGDGARPREEWFRRNEVFDTEIVARFGEVLEHAARGGLRAWMGTPRDRLALVIVLDQFSRNAFRNSPRAFAQDAFAQAVAESAIDGGDDRVLSPIKRNFLYMPLLHAEDRAKQQRAVALFEQLAKDAPPELAEWHTAAAGFARRHRDIVDRFGRFPHRNAILGRESTREELEFLKQSGSGF